MANDPIGAIRQRNENSRNTGRGAPLCDVCDEQHCAQAEEDIDTLLAGIDRLTLNVMVREEWEG